MRRKRKRSIDRKKSIGWDEIHTTLSHILVFGIVFDHIYDIISGIMYLAEAVLFVTITLIYILWRYGL